MIANERQYRITNAAALEFEEALSNLDTVEAHRPPEMRRVMREAMESQLEELREERAAHDALRRASGPPAGRPVGGPPEILT